MKKVESIAGLTDAEASRLLSERDLGGSWRTC